MAESHTGVMRDETFAIVVAVGIVACQWWIMDDLRVSAKWAIPGVAAALICSMILLRLAPVQPHRTRRLVSLGLATLLVVANLIDLFALCRQAFFGSAPAGAMELLFTGAILWIMNVLVFGLVFWVLDAGGPQARSSDERLVRDWVFPQHNDDAHAEPAWHPLFGDYLYVAFTGAIAFGPTDAMPYTRSAKFALALEGAMALTTLGVIIARAVSLAS